MQVTMDQSGQGDVVQPGSIISDLNAIPVPASEKSSVTLARLREKSLPIGFEAFRPGIKVAICYDSAPLGNEISKGGDKGCIVTVTSGESREAGVPFGASLCAINNKAIRSMGLTNINQIFG